MMSTAALAAEPTVALPLRHDTILGVCEGLSQDFGFSATWLRVPISALVLYSPLIAFGVYFGLGVVVLASRLIVPNSKAASPVAIQPNSPANSAAAELSIAA